RRAVSPVTLKLVQTPAPAGSAVKRWTPNAAGTSDGAFSEPALPLTTWMSWIGSAGLIPPATVIPNWAVACRRGAPARPGVVAGVHPSAVPPGAAVAAGWA